MARQCLDQHSVGVPLGRAEFDGNGDDNKSWKNTEMIEDADGTALDHTAEISHDTAGIGGGGEEYMMMMMMMMIMTEVMRRKAKAAVGPPMRVRSMMMIRHYSPH